MATDDHFRFQGFQLPTTTPVPDEVFDTLMYHLTGAELKVLLYICRRTFGFRKESDNISLKQMIQGIKTKDGRVLDRGTGLSKDSVTRVARSLEEKGIIVRSRRQSAEKGDEATSYSLKFLQIPPVSENLTRGGVKIGHGGVRKSDTQQTVLQETVKQHDDVVRQALQNFGVSTSAVNQLTKTYPEQHILDKLELARWLVSTGSPLVAKNPAGWLRKAIEEDYTVPRNHRKSRQRQAKEGREAKAAQAEARQRYLAEEEYRRVKAETKAQLLEQYPPQPIGEGVSPQRASGT